MDRAEQDCRRPGFRDGSLVQVGGKAWTIPAPIHKTTLQFSGGKAKLGVAVDLLEPGALGDAYDELVAAGESGSDVRMFEACASFVAAALLLNYDLTDDELADVVPSDAGPLSEASRAIQDAVAGRTTPPKPSPVGDE